MRATEIREVKKEIRVLGVAVKPSRDGGLLHVVAVVFRGGRWLDGVMRTTAHAVAVTDRLIDMIRASPHHPQIRVLLLHDALIEGGASVDPYRLYKGVLRPVISLSADEGGAAAPEAPADIPVERFELKREAGPLFVSSFGLRSRVAARVLEVSTRDGVIPEALRVAGLVASALVSGLDQNV